MADSDRNRTNVHSMDEGGITSSSSELLSREPIDTRTMKKRRSFSHDYYDISGSGSVVHVVHRDGDGDEVRATTPPVMELHPSSQEEQGDNHSMQPTNCVVETTSLSSSQQHQRQRYNNRRAEVPCFASARQRRRTRGGDMLLMGPVDDDQHAINRERANTCPQHQYHHRCDILAEADQPQFEAVNFSGEDEESGGVGGGMENDFRSHGSDTTDSNERTRSLPSSALLSPEYEAAGAPSSSRRRAASASSIIPPFTSTAPSSHLHARDRTTSSSFTTTTTTPSIVSSYTTTTLKHNLLKLLMLISIYQLLSYTYNTGLSPDVKYQLGEINYDIEEYWYGGRLWSGGNSNTNNRLSASRIVGSSGISFNDDYDGGVGEEEERGVEENSGVGVLNYFISLILGDKFSFQEEGGDVGIVDDEGELNREDVSPGSSTNVSSSKMNSRKKSEETTPAAAPIIVANSNSNNNATKRRPVMAHAISISDARRPVYLPRTSSRRMKTTNDVHWSIPRIAGAIIWIGLMIPILEVGIREISRRYRLGSLLRSRMRRWRGFRRGSTENIHSL